MTRPLAVAVLVLLLAGCTREPSHDPWGKTRTFWSNTVDGRRIPCVQAVQGGLSCDWSAR